MSGVQVYQVLARRKRPQSFSDLIGQEVPTRALSQMVESGRIPHAFLFTGTRGTGKTSSARILAKSLCCEKGPTVHPCQECVFCKQITACAHDDILEIDGASNTGVDHVRELRESARFFPNSARYKIFIIDEVHMLSAGAFNALLKTLEEPPPQVVFVLATTELHKVPMTVRSRCMIVSFKKIPVETIGDHLATILKEEGVSFERDALTLVAREARGSIRDSLSLLEQVVAFCGGSTLTVEGVKGALSLLGQDLADQLVNAIVAGSVVGALEVIKRADGASLDLASILEEAAQQFRAALVLRSTQDSDVGKNVLDLLPDEVSRLEKIGQGISLAGLSEVFRTLMGAGKEVSRARNGLPWAEVALLDCINRSQWLSPTEVVTSESVNRVVPSDVSHPNPPVIGSPSVLVESGVGEIDSVDRFRRVVETLALNHARLAGKLRNAALVSFDHEKLVFSSNPENRVYTRLSDSDLQTLEEALRSCGFADVVIEGLSGQQIAPVMNSMREKKNSPVIADAESEQPLPQSKRSIAESDAVNRKLAWEDKRRRVMSRPEFQNLLHHANEVELLPL